MHVCTCVYCMHVYMYVCMYVCMYLCMYLCIRMYVCMYVCMHVCTCVYCMHVYMYVCMYVCIYVYVCMYVCMSVCMYVHVCTVCMCICMYVCMYLCIRMYVCMYNGEGTWQNGGGTSLNYGSESGGGAQTYLCPPLWKVGGHMPPCPPPLLRQWCMYVALYVVTCVANVCSYSMYAWMCTCRDLCV